jgi:organic hydroperoxide reductase OsmC/OhrA
MTASHIYRATVRWTGNLGAGTRDYQSYTRDHTIQVGEKVPILATSSIGARSDPSRYNPDELVVAALSSCHMLWYLHLCADAGVVVTAYSDEAEGTLQMDREGGGRFVEATLHPHVVVAAGTPETARRLHEAAHRKCFVANSVNFPVKCEPVIDVEPVGEAPRPAGH